MADDIKKRFELKFGVKCPEINCAYCLEAAVNSSGYISDPEVEKIYDAWADKRKKKIYKNMLLPDKVIN